MARTQDKRKIGTDFTPNKNSVHVSPQKDQPTKEVNAKTANPKLTIELPTLGNPVANAAAVSGAPESPTQPSSSGVQNCQAPEATITKLVMVQITMVSMNVPSMAIVPC